MGLKLSDLPPAMRDKVLAQAGEKPRAKKSRAGTGDGAPCPGHCSCGEAFPSYPPWERHWSYGHRWSIDLTPSPD
jgi:hypothetical protein